MGPTVGLGRFGEDKKNPLASTGFRTPYFTVRSVIL